MQSYYINYNGKIIDSKEAIIPADSRGLRYGDGLFETMKVEDGEILLPTYHFERLFKGLAVLKFQLPSSFTVKFLYESILQLCVKNKLSNARVRLMVCRGNGGVFDPVNHHPNYIIQTWELPADGVSLNENGLDIGLYRDAVKAIDILSNLKHNNYLPYIMAALHAKENKWNDCLVLNSEGRICDASIANIFLLKDNKVFTPALSEGCVAGVMRRHLMDKLPSIGYIVQETKIEIKDLIEAEEIWLTNAIYKMKWVKSFHEKKFNPKNAQIVFTMLFSR